MSRRSHTVNQTADALLDRLIADEARVDFRKENSWLVAYPELLAFFKGPDRLTRHHVIVGAHIAYGWMPTMLDFRSDAFDDAARLLNDTRAGRVLSDDEIRVLIGIVNNSLVGASKVLHFVNPDLNPIWDSRVCQYLHSKQLLPGPALGAYRLFGDACRELGRQPSDGGPPEVGGVKDRLSRHVASRCGACDVHDRTRSREN